MWKHVAASQVGTSHLDSGLPCQDAYEIEVYDFEIGQALIFACSDGAGSASHSQIGSQLACECFLRFAKEYLQTKADDSLSLGIHESRMWIREIRKKLVEKAVELDVELRELACTLLAGILLERHSFFMQIGDGAIVAKDDVKLIPVFWPQSGEYVNTTNFLTDEESELKLDFLESRRVDELAVFTDGLERLLLRFDDKSVHEPAIAPMLRYLESANSEQMLNISQEITEFLDSPQINERTDDDKTLILGIRTPSDASLH